MLPTLDELRAQRDRLKAEATQLRTALIKNLSECELGAPAPPELFDAFSRLVFIGSHLQDVEDAITVTLTH
jgi:hypothetical protein